MLKWLIEKNEQFWKNITNLLFLKWTALLLGIFSITYPVWSFLSAFLARGNLVLNDSWIYILIAGIISLRLFFHLKKVVKKT